jgi:hypothetical protein
MRDPSGKIKDEAGFFQIQRIINKCVCVEIVPHMIERHDDHDQAPKQIDGFDPAGCKRIHQIGGMGCFKNSDPVLKIK